MMKIRLHNVTQGWLDKNSMWPSLLTSSKLTKKDIGLLLRTLAFGAHSQDSASDRPVQKEALLSRI